MDGMILFYYTMEEGAVRIVSSPLGYLEDPFVANEEYNTDGEAYVVMLCKVVKVYTVHDLVEEFCLCRVYPVRAGSEVKHWNAEGEEWIPVPDFAKCFGLTKERTDPDRAESIGDRILGRETPKEFNEGQKLVGPHCRNCVFDFFAITAPVRVSSREVASQKGAAHSVAVKKAEAAKGSKGSWLGPTKPSKHLKIWSSTLASILESPTVTEVAASRDAPEVPPLGEPLAVAPLRARAPDIASLPLMAMPSAA